MDADELLVMYDDAETIAGELSESLRELVEAGVAYEAVMAGCLTAYLRLALKSGSPGAVAEILRKVSANIDRLNNVS